MLGYCRAMAGSIEGPRRVLDPMRVNLCLPRVPWSHFCLWGKFAPPPLIKDSETSAWWGLNNHHWIQRIGQTKNYFKCFRPTKTSMKKIFASIIKLIKVPTFFGYICPYLALSICIWLFHGFPGYIPNYRKIVLGYIRIYLAIKSQDMWGNLGQLGVSWFISGNCRLS